MTKLSVICAARKKEILNDLSACDTPDSAANSLEKWMLAIRDEFLLMKDMPYDKRRVNAYLNIATVASGMISAVDPKMADGLKPSKKRSKRRQKWEERFAQYSIQIAIVLSAAAIGLFTQNMDLFAVLALLAAIAVQMAGMRIQNGKTEPVAAIGIDADAMYRKLENLMDDIDGALMENGVPVQPEEELTPDLLEAVQMLMEAQIQDDGAYAIKAIPSFAQAMARQDIQAVMYTQENKKYFDIYPGAEPHKTIRPAILRGEKVLLRGQATG